MRADIVIFISGSGSNFRAISDAIDRGDINARISAVIADRPCSGSQYAIDQHIPFILIERGLPPAQFADSLLRMMPPSTRLIVLAGYLSILPAAFIDAWAGRIINLHPSLLPRYGGEGMYGLNVHRAVIEAGDTVSGCTVHYVDSGVDTGEIIAQAEVPVYNSDDPVTLQQRIQAQEHRLLCRVVAQLCSSPLSSKSDKDPAHD